MKTTADTGKWGEQVVVEHLRAEGCVIAAQNWRCGRCEIDIIAADRTGCLRFVEVKTRAVGGWESGEAAITPSKCRALKRAASAYMACRGGYDDFRFDLAVVEYGPDGSFELRYVKDFIESHW